MPLNVPIFKIDFEIWYHSHLLIYTYLGSCKKFGQNFSLNLISHRGQICPPIIFVKSEYTNIDRVKISDKAILSELRQSNSLHEWWYCFVGRFGQPVSWQQTILYTILYSTVWEFYLHFFTWSFSFNQVRCKLTAKRSQN